MPKKTNKVIVRRDPGLSRCPSCGEINTLRRSKVRSFTETLIKSTTLWKVFRCSKCGWRGYRSYWVVTSASLKNLIVYLVFALLAGLTVRTILGKFMN